MAAHEDEYFRLRGEQLEHRPRRGRGLYNVNGYQFWAVARHPVTVA